MRNAPSRNNSKNEKFLVLEKEKDRLQWRYIKRVLYFTREKPHRWLIQYSNCIYFLREKEELLETLLKLKEIDFLPAASMQPEYFNENYGNIRFICDWDQPYRIGAAAITGKN